MTVRRGIVLTCLASVLGTASCDRGGAEPASTLSPDAPSVLLVTLDTTRADRVGCYGHQAAQTPGLDALAASGILFEQAFCQVPLTLPSHTSLLTGTYPASNGVRINGAVALGDDLPTLAEVFRGNGYRTGAFVSAAVLDAAFGLSPGVSGLRRQHGQAERLHRGGQRAARRRRL